MEARFFHQMGQIKLRDVLPSLAAFLAMMKTQMIVGMILKVNEIEDKVYQYTALERQWESHFSYNTRRSSSGQFIVRMLFMDNPNM